MPRADKEALQGTRKLIADLLAVDSLFVYDVCAMVISSGVLFAGKLLVARVMLYSSLEFAFM